MFFSVCIFKKFNDNGAAFQEKTHKFGLRRFLKILLMNFTTPHKESAAYAPQP